MHFLGVATWFGGLVCLLYVLPAGVINADTRQQFIAHAVRRFPSLAAASLVLIVATGVVETYLQVGSWDAMLQTAYGLSIMAKIGLLGVTLLFAAFNLFIASPGLMRAAMQQSVGATLLLKRLFLSVHVEVALISVALVVAAVLTGLTPARDQMMRDAMQAENGPVDQHLNAQGTNVRPDFTGPHRSQPLHRDAAEQCPAGARRTRSVDHDL